MKNNIKKFDPELFKGIYQYYANYRPGIPEQVINVMVEHFNIKLSDRVLDIGCGTGQVALAMEGKCGEGASPAPERSSVRDKLQRATEPVKG